MLDNISFLLGTQVMGWIIIEVIIYLKWKEFGVFGKNNKLGVEGK